MCAKCARVSGKVRTPSVENLLGGSFIHRHVIMDLNGNSMNGKNRLVVFFAAAGLLFHTSVR